MVGGADICFLTVVQRYDWLSRTTCSLDSQDGGFINRVHAGRLGRHMGTIWVIGL